MLKLYHNNMSSCAQKVRYVLAEKGLDWESEELNLRAGDQHTEEYLKLNPAGVVPTLVHDGRVIVESGVICEYLDDAFPSPQMRPEDPYAIARMRLWIKLIDEHIHAQAGVISSGIAFRFQHLARGEDAARERIEAIPDERKRERQRSIIFEGVDSPLFAGGVRAFADLLLRMDAALAEEAYLVADRPTLADVVCIPYVVRLDHLRLKGMWDDLPRIAEWYAKMSATAAFTKAFLDWEDLKYRELMTEKGDEYWPRIREILG